jgi:flagellar protein FliO/FliZ
MTGQGYAWVVLWLMVIVVLIPVSLWVFKRSGAAGLGRGGAAGLRQIATLALGPQQRVMTVEVGEGESRRWLVLGVTPNQVTTLHVMPAGETVEVPVRPAAGFAQMLNRFQSASSGDQGGGYAR